MFTIKGLSGLTTAVIHNVIVCSWLIRERVDLDDLRM